MVIRVVIDTRETDAWNELKDFSNNDGTQPWYTEKLPLHIGDFAFYLDDSDTPLVVFERKTVDDLAASQKDGRYREQRNRLLALRGAGKGTVIGYIIEAPPLSENLTKSWGRTGEFKEIHLLQTVLRLQFRYSIPVFFSANIKNTIEWIKRTAVLLALDSTVFQTGIATNVGDAAKAYAEAIHIKKAENNTPEKIFMSFLLAIPGLGAKSAEAIALTVEYSFTRLFTMTEDELINIKTGKRKLGKTAGAAIYTALHN
jgi:ERCC4-type nuclease